MPRRVGKCLNAQDTTLKIEEKPSWGRRRDFTKKRGEACHGRSNNHHAGSEDAEGEVQCDFGARCGIPCEVTVRIRLVRVRRMPV